MVGINECECVILFFVCVMFRLWLSTVNTLCHPVEVDSPLENTPYTDEELTKDPLTVLRCDGKIFRCVSLFYHWEPTGEWRIGNLKGHSTQNESGV